MQRNIFGYTRAAAAALLGMIALANACGGNSDGGADDTAESGGSGGHAGTLPLGGASAITGGAVGMDGGASSNEAGAPATGGSVGTGGSTGFSGSTGSAGTASELCPDGSCVCANGLDDDGDGLVDGFDPECIGPTDNDEGSFATGIPGDNRDPKWQDCFFDGNSGAGDDGCRYATECLTGEKDQDDPDCSVTQDCLDFCIDRTPSGCDCFGCCTVGLSDGSSVDILTLSTCSLDNVEDEEACPRCTKSTTCENTCGECELCLGKTEADLPESCWPDNPPDGSAGAPSTDDGGTPEPPPPPYTCDEGVQVCSSTLPCAPGQYCQLGCCAEEFIR